MQWDRTQEKDIIRAKQNTVLIHINKNESMHMYVMCACLYIHSIKRYEAKTPGSVVHIKVHSFKRGSSSQWINQCVEYKPCSGISKI